MIGKCLEYADLGVANIVVLDPDHRRQYVFANDALQLSEINSLRLPKAGIDLPFPVRDLFSELDEMRNAVCQTRANCPCYA